MEFSALHKLLLPHTPGAPEFVLDAALLRAAREFCMRAGAWRESLTVTVAAGSTYAALPAVSGGKVWRAIEAKIGNRPLPPMSVSKAFGARDEHGSPMAYLLERDGTLTVWPAPRDDTDIALLATYIPSVAATGIPDNLGDTWAEAIVHGAAGIVLSQQGAPWFNADLSKFHSGEFDRRIADAAIDERVGAGAPRERVRSIIL